MLRVAWRIAPREVLRGYGFKNEGNAAAWRGQDGSFWVGSERE